jgi:hypothetical protein
MKQIRIFFALSLLLMGTALGAQEKSAVIASGIPWFDDHGNIVNAHGACIVEDHGRYYLFGESKSDWSNAFSGFSCYSSDNLVNWKFERMALPLQKDGILGPNRVGERVKVMRCPKTGKYMMYMHTDDMAYKDPQTAVAIADSINGEYRMLGPLTFEGKPIRRWDMGTFQDTDGKGYILIHHGPIYQLSDDYLTIEKKVAHVKGCGEAPAMFKKDGQYFLLCSNLTFWERNDNYYFSAPSIAGPWTRQGLFCPKGTRTYNSQSTFVFPLKVGNDTVPMYMGDRWSYPRQGSAATYVWQPIRVEGTRISIPQYHQFWETGSLQAVNLTNNGKRVGSKRITARGDWKQADGRWQSQKKGSTLVVDFKGEPLAIKGLSNVNSCYAKVSILRTANDTLFSTLVDFYSNVPEESVKFITPEMKKGRYKLLIENTADMPVCMDKRKRVYGSKGTQVNVLDIYKLNRK